jgi:ribosomal protein S18 acetylase RimI-like enzyme
LILNDFLFEEHGMNYTIVTTTEDHIEGFWAALDSVARERKYIAFLEGPPVDGLRKFVQKNLKANGAQYVAIVEGNVVGWCDVTRLERPIFKHTGTMGLGLIKKYRGIGIGKSLIQAALDKARAIGLTRVELTVREGNSHALEIYKKFGFQVEGVKKKAVCIDGVYEDITCMALLFEEIH